MRAPIFVCLLLLFFFLIHFSSAQSCKNETFSDNKVYATCDTLPYLGATLHWTYHADGHTIDVAYRAAQASSGWVGWAINPVQLDMLGSNAFLAFFDDKGTLTVWNYQFQSFEPDLQDENLTFPVLSRGAEYSGGAFTIYATLRLPENKTSQYTVWQSSTLMANGVPNGHIQYGDHTMSKLLLDFETGATTAGGNSFLHRENIHGVLNAISWGTLLPTGVIMARYVKVVKAAGASTWFLLHIAFQCAGYILGVSGWALGLNLATNPASAPHHRHRNIGITLFCFATLQVLALFLRPKKDSKHRIYWNIYHWTLGYLVIILSIVNVFKGFDILSPPKKYKNAYIGVLSTLAAVALLIEVYTWALVFRRKTMRVSETGNIDLGGVHANGGPKA